MPGPIVHIGHALFYGFILLISTKEKFSGLHCLVLAFNAFLGPDIGSFIEWLFRLVLPSLADFCMSTIHNPWSYNLSVGPLIALALTWISKYIVLKDATIIVTDNTNTTIYNEDTTQSKGQYLPSVLSPYMPENSSAIQMELEDTNNFNDSKNGKSNTEITSFPLYNYFSTTTTPESLANSLRWWTNLTITNTSTTSSTLNNINNINNNNNNNNGCSSSQTLVVLAKSMPRPLYFKQCYLLGIAGCLLHFQLDYIFEENGASPLFRKIISTGYWSSPQPPLSIPSVIVVGLCTISLFFGFFWINFGSKYRHSSREKIKNSFILFVTVFSIYISYLYILQVLLGNTAVVGEEADLGTLPFLICFYFAPLVLCLLTVT